MFISAKFWFVRLRSHIIFLLLLLFVPHFGSKWTASCWVAFSMASYGPYVCSLKSITAESLRGKMQSIWINLQIIEQLWKINFESIVAFSFFNFFYYQLLVVYLKYCWNNFRIQMIYTRSFVVGFYSVCVSLTRYKNIFSPVVFSFFLLLLFRFYFLHSALNYSFYFFVSFNVKF